MTFLGVQPGVQTVGGPLGRHSALIVDNGVATLKKLALALEGDGFEVATAYSTVEAREATARRCPELMLLDVNLPDGDGRIFCHELKFAPATQDCLVILTSGREVGLQNRFCGLNLGAAEARALSNRLPETRECERRFAHELHDGAGQWTAQPN